MYWSHDIFVTNRVTPKFKWHEFHWKYLQSPQLASNSLSSRQNLGGGSHIDHVSEGGVPHMVVVTHLVSDGKAGFFLLQLLTACLVLQHGPNCLLHPANKQDYKFTNAMPVWSFSGKSGITKIFIFHKFTHAFSMALPRHGVSAFIILVLVPSFRKGNSCCSFRVAYIVTDVTQSQVRCKYNGGLYMPTKITVEVIPHNKKCNVR
jgi:hypothetical protein